MSLVTGGLGRQTGSLVLRGLGRFGPTSATHVPRRITRPRRAPVTPTTPPALVLQLVGYARGPRCIGYGTLALKATARGAAAAPHALAGGAARLVVRARGIGLSARGEVSARGTVELPAGLAIAFLDD